MSPSSDTEQEKLSRVSGIRLLPPLHAFGAQLSQPISMRSLWPRLLHSFPSVLSAKNCLIVLLLCQKLIAVSLRLVMSSWRNQFSTAILYTWCPVFTKPLICSKETLPRGCWRNLCLCPWRNSKPRFHSPLEGFVEVLYCIVLNGAHLKSRKGKQKTGWCSRWFWCWLPEKRTTCMPLVFYRLQDCCQVCWDHL